MCIRDRWWRALGLPYSVPWYAGCEWGAYIHLILGDKEKADEYKQYNADHVSDIVQPGASAWHTDWLGENKVASPLCTSHSPNARAGGVQNVGHLFAFGNTEERLHRDILGCRERDRPADPPFDHNTGKGHVAFHKGDYYDACLLYTSPSPRDATLSRMPSSA